MSQRPGEALEMIVREIENLIFLALCPLKFATSNQIKAGIIITTEYTVADATHKLVSQRKMVLPARHTVFIIISTH